MAEFIELRRLKPMTHSYFLSDYSDEESFSTLPMIVRAQPEKNIHLPKHTKKLVHRFLNNLKHVHDYQNINGNESDSSIDDCDICHRLRSAMDEDLYRSGRIVCENPSKHDKHIHVIETLPSNNPPAITINQAPIYPPGYTNFVNPRTGLTYAYDPNWQYSTNPGYRPNNPSTMDKATYTRITDDTRHHSNDRTVIVHRSRHPSPRIPTILIEEPRRRSRKTRSRTIVTERIPRRYTTDYI